jgi:hypothetical protein
MRTPIRKPLVALVGATALTLASLSTLSAQVLPPAAPAPRLPQPAVLAPAPAAPSEASAVASELAAIARLRPRLAARGLDRAIVEGPMMAVAPGQADEMTFVVDAEIEALLGAPQPEAWLVWTTGGRWWLWEYGVAAPADERARVYEAHAREQASLEGRGLD